MTIGDRLKTERERLGFTQPAFAAIGGTTKKSQIDYEKNLTQPRASYFDAIAKVGADIAYIITGAQELGKPVASTPEEQMMLKAFRNAPQELQNAALAVLLSKEITTKNLKTSKDAGAIRQIIKGNNQGIIAGRDVKKVNR